MNAFSKIAARLINFAVERWFPNGCFYGDSDPMKAFEANDGKTIGRAACFVLVRNCRDTGAIECATTIMGMTVNGKDIGDWQVVVRRIDDRGKGEEFSA